jgi:hypothetical protein
MVPDSNNTTPIEQAKRFLTLHDSKTHEIRLRNCIGDVRVRGGSRVFVSINFGDINISTYLMVNAVTHHFEQNYHGMDIDLIYMEKAGNWKVTYDNDAAVLSKIKAAEESKKKSNASSGSTYGGSGTYSQSEQGAYSKCKALGAGSGQAAGVLGNIRCEDDTYDPYASNGTHTGLFQMDGDRWSKYESWCNQNGNDPYCNDNQIEYVCTVENGNIFTGDNCSWGAIPDDPEQAAKYFNDHIEVSETSYSNGGNSSDRISAANNVYTDIQNETIGVESLQYPEVFNNGGSSYSNGLFDAGVNAVVDNGNNYFGVDGCVKASTTLLSYSNEDMAEAVQRGIADGDTLETYLLDEKGYTEQSYTGTNAYKGDIILYPDNLHTAVADGNGGCYSNSTGAGYKMIHFDDANDAWRSGESPAKVIHMNVN